MSDQDPSPTAPHHPGREGTTRRPAVVVLDVNETLSDMAPMARRFADVGAPEHLARAWFAGVLRDGFALAAVGASVPFATLAADGLRTLLAGSTLDRGTDDAVQHVMDGFSSLPVHPDVPDGIRGLAAGGVRVVTLTNGSASVAEGLLERAGVREHVEAVLSVEDAPRWKPAPEAYAHALRRCGVEASDAMLVAAHPWDVDGASRAGLATTWIDRQGTPYPGWAGPPDLSVGSLTALVEALAR